MLGGCWQRYCQRGKPTRRELEEVNLFACFVVVTKTQLSTLFLDALSRGGGFYLTKCFCMDALGDSLEVVLLKCFEHDKLSVKD